MKTTKILEFYGRGCVLEKVTVAYTHRCDDGDTLLRGDPQNNHWAAFHADGSASNWFGSRPVKWDDAKAVEEKWSAEYEHESDYS